MDTPDIFEGIVGKSPAIRKIFELIDKVASSNSTILITGDSGTGKELIARAIHNKSQRKDNRLIAINCGAIPEGLMESELFGHEKGAFTGSVKTRIGKFELAHNSTIFLDEIGDMGYNMQVKILRVLQEQEIERVGGTSVTPIDVRVIAATNKNLEAEIKENRFRQDLYYRLNVIPIFIPPLRERREDILALISYFLEYFNATKAKAVDCLSDAALNYMINYSWPGNVRELENIMERMIIIKGEGRIDVEDLPEKLTQNGNLQDFPMDERVIIHSPSTDSSSEACLLPEIDLPAEGVCLKTLIEEVEKSLIQKALSRTDGVKNKAARLLNLNRTTLVEKIKKIGLEKNI